MRAKIFLEQTVRRSDPKDIRLGMSVFLIVGGLFKKVIVANYLSTDFVDGVFRAPTEYSRLDLLLGMYAYALQIYCDFSAYTDIAIGIANLLGYQFPQNFNQPYRASSVQDFWRRWHITLSSWLRDYLYIPLGGSRDGTWFTYRNILITMLLGGLWHGASWNFVIWGGLHGVALVVERAARGDGRARPPRPHPRRCVWWFVTLHFVCLTWVFFRAPTFDTAIAYLSTLVSGEAVFSTTVTPLVATHAGARRAHPDHSGPLVQQPGGVLRSRVARREGRGAVRGDLPDRDRCTRRRAAVHLFPVLGAAP